MYKRIFLSVHVIVMTTLKSERVSSQCLLIICAFQEENLERKPPSLYYLRIMESNLH